MLEEVLWLVAEEQHGAQIMSRQYLWLSFYKRRLISIHIHGEDSHTEPAIITYPIKPQQFAVVESYQISLLVAESAHLH